MKNYNETIKNEIRKLQLVDEYLSLPGFKNINRKELLEKLK